MTTVQEKVWFYAKGDQQFGPYLASELRAIAASGQLTPTDLIWKQGLPQWLPVSSVKGLMPAAQTINPPPLPSAQKNITAPRPLASVKPSTPQASSTTQVLPKALKLGATEKILFEGSAMRNTLGSLRQTMLLLRGRIQSNVYCFITDKRLLLTRFDEVTLEISGKDIKGIEHGAFGSAISVEGGEVIRIQFLGDKNAGQAALERLHNPSLAPVVSQIKVIAPVSTKTGWAIAFSPLLGNIVDLIVIAMVNRHIILIWYIVGAGMTYSDDNMLQKAGHNTRTNGLSGTFWVPGYLFSRARVYGHSKAYAITWCVLATIEILVMLAQI